MREAANIAIIIGSVLCLLSLLHLFLAAWLIPSWLRVYPTYASTGARRGVGLTLAAFAWIGACVIVSLGTEAMLWWVPRSIGFVNESGDFQSWIGYAAGGFGLFAGTGWVWSVLRVGRQNHIGPQPIA